MDESEIVKLRRNIGFILQAHNLFESLTALQNVKMALALKELSAPEMDRRATDILVKLGLQERIRAKPKSMSGGQKQRVAVARAVVNSPALILAG